MAYGSAEFVGPTPAQLAQGSDKDFQDAMKEMGPSITPDMEKWYKSFMQQIRQVQKPTTPVA